MCGCRKNRAGSSLVASAKVAPRSFKVIFPSGEEKTYLTALEAKMAIRKAGGGSVIPA